MKLRKTLFFILLTALAFIVSCHGKSNKYDEFDDWDSDGLNDGDQLPDDTEPAEDADTNENEPDGDADSQDNSDADTNPDETPDETDEDTGSDDTDLQDDSDADTNPGKPDDETGDEDSIPEKEDPATICTDQNKCFGNQTERTCPSSPDDRFFGQDAQYAKKGYCLQKSYTAINDDLVKDNITGLIWQRKLPSEGCANSSEEGFTICTKQEAADYCSNLNYAGFNDWRLPTPAEFATIKSFGSVPAVNTEKFPLPTNANEKFFWTAYSVIAESGKSWAVDFHKGETISLDEQTGLNRFSYVRCVRGEELTKPDFKTYNENEDVIVYDDINNLKWTQIIIDDKGEAKELSWEEALKECEDLEYAGETDWRLPNINELASIIDYSRYLPASEFPGISPVIFWSSTSYVGSYTTAWVADISSGTVRIYNEKLFPAKVICVK